MSDARRFGVEGDDVEEAAWTEVVGSGRADGAEREQASSETDAIQTTIPAHFVMPRSSARRSAAEEWSAWRRQSSFGARRTRRRTS